MAKVTFVQRSTGVEVQVEGEIDDGRTGEELAEKLSSLVVLFLDATEEIKREEITGYKPVKAKTEAIEEPEAKARKAAIKAHIAERYSKRK